MDEILLRADKARVVCNQAQEAWQEGGCEGDLDDMMNRALCCAQVRQVVEWMEQNDLRTVDTAMIARGYGVLLTKEAMQALRATAEEVRE